MEKANQRWKESGSTLSFKEWIERENQKNKSQSTLNLISSEEKSEDVLVIDEEPEFKNATADELISQTINNTQTVRTEEDNSKLFGLDKKILYFSTILLVGSLGFYFYKRYKENRG